VHRDLKPANVMLTPHGVKLLDFGLAALRPANESVRGFDGAVTAEGAILGTLPYMSPEQIQGKPTDERTDIFALGAMLFEMLTVKRAFEADNPASVIAAVLERDPPQVSVARGDVPRGDRSRPQPLPGEIAGCPLAERGRSCQRTAVGSRCAGVDDPHKRATTIASVGVRCHGCRSRRGSGCGRARFVLVWLSRTRFAADVSLSDRAA
jgi:serine/threonine protein kinase